MQKHVMLWKCRQVKTINKIPLSWSAAVLQGSLEPGLALPHSKLRIIINNPTEAVSDRHYWSVKCQAVFFGHPEHSVQYSFYFPCWGFSFVSPFVVACLEIAVSDFCGLPKLWVLLNLYENLSAGKVSSWHEVPVQIWHKDGRTTTEQWEGIGLQMLKLSRQLPVPKGGVKGARKQGPSMNL